MNQQIAKYIIFSGILIALIGVIFFFFGNAFKWLGRLPGDIRYEGKNTRIYFPIATMIVISIALTILINLIRKIL